MGAKLIAPAEGWWPSATKWEPFGPPNGGPLGPLDKYKFIYSTNTYIAQIQIGTVQIGTVQIGTIQIGTVQIGTVRTNSLRRSSRSSSRSSTKHIYKG